MNIYRIPEQPPAISVVWDALGHEWAYEQQPHIGGWLWENPLTGEALDWDDLVIGYGPVTDYPPEPDWLDAPAVLATCGCRGIELWHPNESKDGLWISVSGEHALWSTLRDVTPLYPKEEDGEWVSL